MSKHKKNRRRAALKTCDPNPTSATIACIWGTVTLCVTSMAWGRRKPFL